MDRPRMDAITGLRFFAACAVVHLHTAELYPQGRLPGRSTLWMQAVSFFFMLSGFILASVYPRLQSWASIRRFLVARWARIYPVYALALLTMVLLVPRWAYHHPTDTWPIVQHLTMTQSWGPGQGNAFAFNTPAWSISTEIGFYLCFPLLIWRFASTWWWKLGLAGLLTLGVIYICQGEPFRDLPLSTRQSAFAVLALHPAARLFEFLLGMTLAHVRRHSSLKMPRHPRLMTLWECVAAFAALASVAHAARLTRWLDQSMGLGEAGIVALNIGLSSVPAFAVLILVFAAGQGLISRWLASQTMILLGEASFALYLFHFPIIRWIATQRSEWQHLPHGLVIAAAWLLSIGISILVYRAWERPCRQWIVSRLAHKPSPAPEPTSIPIPARIAA